MALQIKDSNVCKIFQIRGELDPYPIFKILSHLQSQLKNATMTQTSGKSIKDSFFFKKKIKRYLII